MLVCMLLKRDFWHKLHHKRITYFVGFLGLFILRFTAFHYLAMYLGFVLVIRQPVSVGLFCRYWLLELELDYYIGI